MSQFLGRQDCIESLRKDLVDLQGTILDVFSRTGPVRFSSWKFPDKLSCNLDMAALLEQYEFMDGEDAFNQHSHIVLLELVIDRLLLLLQSFNSYVEQLRCGQRREGTQPRGCVSAGLVVRHCWSNLVQLGHFKTKPKTCDGDEAETVSTVSLQMSSRSDCCRHCLSASSSTSSFKLLPQNHIPSSPTLKTPPRDSVRSVSCQTVESSLIPCNACHQVQSILTKTGDALVELLQGEGLPCSLQPLLAVVEDTTEVGNMTAGDVAQWGNEQFRDMRRLAKHLQDVRGSVQPLKDRLAVAETERDKYRSQLEKAQKEFRQEMEKHQANTVQMEFSLRKAQRSMKEIEQRLQEEQQQLKRETLSLEESNSRLKEKVSLQQDALQVLECEKNALQEEVKTLHRREEEACCNLQQRIQHLESQLSETQVLLDKENAKYDSACHHQEVMHAKQKALLDRMDALDEDREELQRQLGESEERQVELQNQLQQIREEKERQQVQLTQERDWCLELQREKQDLETHIGELKNNVAELKEHVKTLSERVRLLVAFPELSPLQPQTTGNVVLDMEQQLHANSIRIKIMEQENTTLHSSLKKLRERAQQNATTDCSLPSTPVENQQNHLTQMQNPLQSSSEAQAGYNTRGKKAGGGESGLNSDRSVDLVSTATGTPSSLQLHLQNLQLNTAARSHTKTQRASLLSHSKGLNRRRK